MKAKKKPSLPALVEKADRAASVYIRLKYADSDGIVSCVTCGQKLHWKESHCAHYIERGRVETRWLEENLHPACPGCNVFHKEFHKRRYTVFIIDTYGRDFLEELERLSKIVVSPSRRRQLAEEAIEYYTNELRK